MSQQLSPSQSKDLESKYEEKLGEIEEDDDDDDILGLLSHITGNPTKASNAQSRYQQELSELSREIEQSSKKNEDPSVNVLKSAHPLKSGFKSTSNVENSVSQC